MRHLGGGLRLCFGKWLVTVPCTGLSTVPRPPLHSASLHYSPQVYRESYWDTPPPRRGLSLTRPPPPSLQGGRVDCAIASPVTAQTSAPSVRAAVFPDEGEGGTCCSLIPQGGLAWGCAADFKLITVLQLKDVIGATIAEIFFFFRI